MPIKPNSATLSLVSKQTTTNPRLISVELKPANAKYVRQKKKQMPNGSIKEVVDEAVRHFRNCPKST